MKADMNDVVREVAQRLAEGFSTPDEGLELGQRYLVSLEELLNYQGGPELAILNAVRRMMAGLVVEMLRERWRVPGVPTFTFTMVEGYPAGVEITVGMKTAAADLAERKKAATMRAEMTELVMTLVVMVTTLMDPDDEQGWKVLDDVSNVFSRHIDIPTAQKLAARLKEVVAAKTKEQAHG